MPKFRTPFFVGQSLLLGTTVLYDRVYMHWNIGIKDMPDMCTSWVEEAVFHWSSKLVKHNGINRPFLSLGG